MNHGLPRKAKTSTDFFLQQQIVRLGGQYVRVSVVVHEHCGQIAALDAYICAAANLDAYFCAAANHLCDVRSINDQGEILVWLANCGVTLESTGGATEGPGNAVLG